MKGKKVFYYLLILCNLPCRIIDAYAYFIILSNTFVGVLMSLNPGYIMSYCGIYSFFGDLHPQNGLTWPLVRLKSLNL